MSSLIIIRQTKEEWEAQDIALPETYIGVESDIVNGVETGTLKAKLFDGIHTWDELDYWDIAGGGSSGAIWGAITGNIDEQEDLQSILSTFQPVDTDLTTIAALTPSNDDFLQRKSGAWTNRNIAQVITDLGSNDARHLSTIGALDVAGTGTISPAVSAFEYDVVRATGVLTGTRTVNWPGNSTDRRQVLFWNDTTGNFDLYVKQTSEAGTGIRTTQGAQSILINDGTEVIDVTAAISRVPFYCLEYDGNPKTVDLGTFYPMDVDLGTCFYECWVKLGTGANNSCYDWSSGFGGTHAMLRNPYGGNSYRGFMVTDASNTTPIVITTSKPHGLTGAANEILNIVGVLGNTAANVSALIAITVLSPTTFSITGSVGNGVYLGGGVGHGYPSVGGWGLVSFTADDVPYIGQWAHSATAYAEVSNGAFYLIQYYDGIPVGYTAMPGTRMEPNLGGNGGGFLGGSDHNNFVGRIQQYRIFEGDQCPVNNKAGFISTQYAFNAFRPSTLLSHETYDFESRVLHASALFNFTKADQVIADLSEGFPQGRPHTARIYGSIEGVGNYSTYPGPTHVIDNAAPNALGIVKPVQPAGRVYTPPSAPGGALIYDSFERKNSTLAFDGVGGLGSTESGSLGPKAWQNAPVTTGHYSFGILNEWAVPLSGGFAARTWVDTGLTDIDIRLTGRALTGQGTGGGIGILFRHVDANNFWYLEIYAGSPIGWLLYKYVAGVLTLVTGGTTGGAWDVGRVITKSDGTLQCFMGATSLYSGSQAALASATGAGMFWISEPTGMLRFKHFTVYAA